jgi:hypothetical protein
MDIVLDWPRSLFLDKKLLVAIALYNDVSRTHTEIFDLLQKYNILETASEEYKRAWVRTLMIQGRLLHKVNRLGPVLIKPVEPYWDFGRAITIEQSQLYSILAGKPVVALISTLNQLEENFFKAASLSIPR